MPEWWEQDKTTEPNQWWNGDSTTALQNDPNDVTIRAKESLEVADNLELPLISAEEIADVLDGQKVEQPGFIKRGIFGFVNKAFVQPFKNIISEGGLGSLDTELEALGRIRKIKEETGREIDADEFAGIIAKSRLKVSKRIQEAGPNLILPPAEGVTEKGLEIATGLGAFVTKLIIARKFVGGSGVASEIAAFEVVNQIDLGPTGLGVLLAGSLGLIGKIPAASLGGKGLKLAGQGGALASVTAARGGEPEDIAVAFFLPSILHTFNQFPNLITGKAWDIKTAKGAKELGLFKGVPIKNIKQWSAAMRDAAKVKLGTMTPKRWGAKHGKNLQDFSNKIGKTYEDVTKITGEMAKPPAKAIVKPPSKLVKAKPTLKAPITPAKPKAVGVAELTKKIDKAFVDKDALEMQRLIQQLPRGSELWERASNLWVDMTRVQPPTVAKAEGVEVEGLVKDKIYETSEIPRELFKGHTTINDNNKAGQPTVWQLSNGQVVMTTDPYQSRWKLATEVDLNTWGPERAWVKKGIAAIKAQPVAKAEGEISLKEAEPAKVVAKKAKDILGGVDPINQIHIALKAAKEVRPITEAAKKEALRKRVGAAAGALKASLKRGEPAEQAILKSTGLLKGPLTEYTQIYESIEDTLDPSAKDAAYGMIATHPDLKYFEVVNTQKSFQKLLAGSSLTPTEAAQIERVFGKALDDIVKPRTKKSDLYERLIATWKAGLLTGMKTSGLNILSTASHAVSETAKDVPAALVDSGVALVTGERTVAFTAKGYGFGFIEGLGKGWKYMKTGYDERNVLKKYDYKKTNFGTSKTAKAQQAYVEFIFHLLGAEDQPFYYGALSRSLYSQAIAQAKNKGLKGKERQVFVDNLQKNPTDEMLEWAKEDAETAIYTNRTHLGDVAKSIQRVKGGEVIVPFGRTPSAVAMQIVNYSPVGVVKEISEQIHKGKFNQRKFSQAAGRTVVGTGALYLGVQLFKAGLIALGYPDNERERKLWELEGRKPNSIKIGDEWRDVQAFGPLGNLLVIGGYFQQALDSKGSPTEAIIEAMAGGGKSFTEQTFVRGVNLAVDALTDPEASFERWFTSMSGSLVPTIVADIARAQDDRARRAVGPKERIQSRIPIYRKGLPPRIDVFGQDLPRYGGNVLETMIDPTRPSKIRQDVVVDELRRLWDKDIKVSPTLLGDRAGYDILTKEENTQLWRRAGELIYKGLFALVNAKNYKDSNDFAKGQLFELITFHAKQAAKAEIIEIKLAQGKTIMELATSGLLTVDSLEALKYFKEQEKE